MIAMRRSPQVISPVAIGNKTKDGKISKVIDSNKSVIQLNKNIKKSNSPNRKDTFESWSSDETDSSLSSEDVVALPATLIDDRANRGVGNITLSEYETTTDEDEETEEDSSLENSGEYKPLGFTVILGNRSKALYKSKAVSYRVNESEKSNEDLSFSDAPLAVQIQDDRKRFSRQEHIEKIIEAVESESEVEEEEEEEEEKLNAILIRNLVKRLRDPESDVKIREFEELDWDDPNFEKELIALREVASYIEVKETMLKASKDRKISAAARIDQKIKEVVMKIPDIIITKVKSKIVEQAAIPKLSKTTKNEFESPVNPKYANKSSWNNKIISSAKNNALGAISKEAHMGARPSSKKKMTDSMILASGKGYEFKESKMSSNKVAKKKNRESLLISQGNICVPKEATFEEAEKPMRRKRNMESMHLSLQIDNVPDVATEEIVETEYMNPHEISNEVGKSNNINNKRVKEKSKENNLKTETTPKRKRKSRRNRSISLIVDGLPDELDRDDILEKDIALSNKKESSTKEGNSRSKKRRPRNTSNRSTNFTEVVGDEDAGEFFETLEDQIFQNANIPKSIMEGDKSLNEKRRRRRKNETSRNNLSFVDVPEEIADAIVEDGTKDSTAPISTRETRKSFKNSTNNGKEKEEINGVNEKTKKKHHRVQGRRKSRELEYSFVPDEIVNEIVDHDGDSGLINQATSSTHLGSRRTSLMQETSKKSDKSALPHVSSSVHTNEQRKSHARAEKQFNQIKGITKLPEIGASEINDCIIETKNKSNISNRPDSALNNTQKARKSRRQKSNGLNRSQTSFFALPDEEISEVKEFIDENLDDHINRGVSNSVTPNKASRIQSRRRQNSAACSMTSVAISECETMNDNVEFSNQITHPNGIKKNKKTSK